MICLANALQILLLGKLWRVLLSEIFGRQHFRNLPLIRENFFNQIKQSRHLTDIILISQNFKSTGEPSNLAAKRYFFNAFLIALCFAWKKAAVTHMREDEKLCEQGWNFAISAEVFGTVIISSVSSKCGARNVIRLKNQWNKKKLLGRAFSLNYMQGGCRKQKRLWVKHTQTMWDIFKLVVLYYGPWKCWK